MSGDYEGHMKVRRISRSHEGPVSGAYDIP